MHEIYMKRCFDLARLGGGTVSPNPMVGAVLVSEGRIIGEGWHQKYGEAHAEVNCLKSVAEKDRHLIPSSTLYVSLEPCCIYGKTPPCTELILKHGIKKVVVCELDQTPTVNRAGIAILKNAGVEVVHGVLAGLPVKPSDFRNVFAAKKRPFIQLKFAKSSDGFMGTQAKQVWLSNHFSQVLAHKGRAIFDAILVGTKTALTDDPALTNRHWFGKSPIRIVLDRNRVLAPNFKLFDGSHPTWVVTEKLLPGDVSSECLKFLELKFDDGLLENLMLHLYEAKITSLIVEGGANTIQQFLNKGLWDEAAIFSTPKRLGTGIAAPTPIGDEVSSHLLRNDRLTIIRNVGQSR